MQKVRQTQSSQSIEMSQTNRTSPDSLVKQPEDANIERKVWTFNAKRCMFLIFTIICSVTLGYKINATNTVDTPHHTITDTPNFTFLVFCPVAYYPSQSSSEFANYRIGDELRRRRLTTSHINTVQQINSAQSKFDPNRTFLVQAISDIYNEQIELFYCGLTRQFYGDCSTAQVRCSGPGPMFDIPTRDPVDIVWINSLNSDYVPDVSTSCLNSTFAATNIPYCTLMAKINRTQTFLDPTKNDINSKTAYKHMKITNITWPMVTHLHGAQIRPTFDGNPLSWIANGNRQTGIYGIAAFSDDQKCYYDSFDKIAGNISLNPPKLQIIPQFDQITNNYKINRYPNRQNPGSLWFHDHSMHLTSYNVQHGLSGYYILRDAQVQQQIGVGRHCQNLVMYSKTNLTGVFSLNGFQAGRVYRFKFLNNNFDDSGFDVLNISFGYGGCGNSSQRQQFTIIGADSSLFNTGIPNQKYFVIAQAQRLQILIIFKDGYNNISICGAELQSKNIVAGISTDKLSFHHNKLKNSNIQKISSNIQNLKLYGSNQKFQDLCHNNRTQIQIVNLNVPYINLTTVSQQQIAVSRMRPLIWVLPTFTINGRVDFHGAQSQNPMIGTIQDWFLINTIFFAHPIHVHLINFQVIRQYHQRVLVAQPNQNFELCSLYELDFIVDALRNSTDPSLDSYKQTIFPVNSKITINYTQLCLQRYTLYSLPSVIQSMGKIHPQNIVDSNRVSGINILNKVKPQDIQNLKQIQQKLYNPFESIDQTSYKYVENDGAPSPKIFYNRWKDTAYVEPFTVLQYRIRWTKSNFTQQDKQKGTYFHVPADQLRQYPGFVYHCHILPHEDNQMMRPIMMQLPKNVQLNEATPCNYNIQSKKPVLKWADKYNCVNKRCGNQNT